MFKIKKETVEGVATVLCLMKSMCLQITVCGWKSEDILKPFLGVVVPWYSQAYCRLTQMELLLDRFARPYANLIR